MEYLIFVGFLVVFGDVGYTILDSVNYFSSKGSINE